MQENKIKIDEKFYSEDEALKKAINNHRAGDFKNAVKFCKRINEHNPRNSEVYFLSGLAYYHFGFFDAAIYQINRAIKLLPKEKYFYNRGIIYMDLENHEKAKESFEECLKINPGYEKAKELIKEFYG